MRLRFFLLSLSFLTALGCTKKTLEYGLELKDTIRVNLNAEPPTLDWTKSHDSVSSTVLVNLMDGLVSFNFNDPELSLQPRLATEWKSSPDAKRWTFTLRKDVKWTDGTAFTPQQIVDGWQRLLTPATGSPYSYILYNLKNAKAFYDGKIKDFSQVGIQINPLGQIVVDLETAQGFFPYVLTMRATLPIRKELIAKFGEDHWTDAVNIQTLGAYKLKIWDHDKALVMERFDGYYGEKAKTKNVLGYMIEEYSTALSLFQAGKLDFQETVPFNEIPNLKSAPGFRQVANLGMYYYGFNTRKPPFNNLKVRKAFGMAIDRKQITDLLAGGMAPLTSWIPMGMFGYEPQIGLKFDVEQANKFLNEAGYKDRSKFPKVTIGFNTNENHQRIAENVQAQIKKNLGITVEIQNEEWKVYLAQLQTDPPNIYRMGWMADFPDPDTFFALITSTSENNYTGWKNKEFDRLIALGSSEVDKTKRKAIYVKAQKILTEEDVPVVPIYSLVYSLLISPRLRDFPVNSLERLEMKGVSIP
jgi:oligopeptide transport system substrate-binding protein